MFKWMSALVFTSFISIIYGHGPVALYESAVNTPEIAEYYLAEIQTAEALPFILFEKTTNTSDGDPFDFPETIDKAIIFLNRTLVDGVMIDDKKMLSGTSFSTAYSNEPMFFCPKQNSSEICLVPQDFRLNHRLVCYVQPIPTVTIRDEAPCGNHQNTHTYSMGYAICEAPIRSENALAAVYYVCYDTVNQKNLYTSHYIPSPRLLGSHLLLREQQLKYPLLDQPFVPTANRADIRDHLQSWDDWEKRLLAKKPVYRVQMLAPSGDFALGSWIKTAYQYVNMELQHESLYSFWNDLVYLVERQAIEAYKHGIEFYIRTGVFDLNVNLLPNDGQKYNMWVKVVTSTRKDIKDTLQGVVFIANNFVTANIRIQRTILYYCQASFCAEDFRSKTGNKVICCMMNDAIAQLFGLGPIRPDMQMLKINGVN